MPENIKKRLIHSFRHINNIKCASLLYLLASLLLSVSIFLRLQAPPSVWVKYVNIGLFILNYLGGSAVALYYLLTTLTLPKYRSMPKQFSAIFKLIGLFAVVSAILMAICPLGILPEYISLVIPILLAYFTYLAMLKHDGKFLKTQLPSFIGLILAISILLPNITVFACQNSVLSQATNINIPSERIEFIASFVRNASTYNIYRSNIDFWKYLLVGTGACLETAIATKTLLNEAGFEAREVSLPGEDHAFVEVKMNDTWMVVDPGYSFLEPITREQRAAARIREFGAISYAIAYSGSSFIEVTSSYVPTDTIIIKVTHGIEPIVNTQVYLVHKFMSRTLQIPDAATSFYTDANGEVTLHIGALTFNENANEYDTCYWVYVNGKNTGYNVTSTGTGIVRSVEIDLQQCN